MIALLAFIGVPWWGWVLIAGIALAVGALVWKGSSGGGQGGFWH